MKKAARTHIRALFFLRTSRHHTWQPYTVFPFVSRIFGFCGSTKRFPPLLLTYVSGGFVSGFLKLRREPSGMRIAYAVTVSTIVPSPKKSFWSPENTLTRISFTRPPFAEKPHYITA